MNASEHSTCRNDGKCMTDLRGLQMTASHMRCDQRRRARSVDGERWAAETKGVRHAP